MTPYASVALFKRDGRPTFKPPRKEVSDNETQARKAATRFWCGNIAAPDRLTKVILVRRSGQCVEVAERQINGVRNQPWLTFRLQMAEAAELPHIAACLDELGIDPAAAPPVMPDTLEINGVIYRRDI